MAIPFAVIGTSWITESFIRSAHATGSWQLKAIYSRSEATAKAFAAKVAPITNDPDVKLYTSVEALASDSSISAVYIASPNSLHFEHARICLSQCVNDSSNGNGTVGNDGSTSYYKKHIILEKPAASNYNELTSLYTLAADRGCYLLEANRHLHEVNFKVLRDVALPKLLAGNGDGGVGGVSNSDIYGASFSYASYSSRYNIVLEGKEPTPNIFSLQYSGGALVDLGVYPISLAVALFGVPKSQSYAPYIIPIRRKKDVGGEDEPAADGGGFITLRYENFSVGINVSKVYTSTAPSEIYGRNGTIVINATTDIDTVDFLYAKTKERQHFAKPKSDLNLQEEAAEFARIINENDIEATVKLQQISLATVRITQDLRRQNGLLFAVER